PRTFVGGDFFDVYLVDAPITAAAFIKPVLEEFLPRAAGIGFQLSLKIRDAQHTEVVAPINGAHEIKECGFTQAVFQHPDYLAATIVADAEKVDDVIEFLHGTNSWPFFAASDSAV